MRLFRDEHNLQTLLSMLTIDPDTELGQTLRAIYHSTPNSDRPDFKHQWRILMAWFIDNLGAPGDDRLGHLLYIQLGGVLRDIGTALVLRGPLMTEEIGRLSSIGSLIEFGLIVEIVVAGNLGYYAATPKMAALYHSYSREQYRQVEAINQLLPPPSSEESPI